MSALRLWLCGLLLACLQWAGAQDLAAIPTLTRPVTDLTATLDANQIAQMESTLRAFEQRKGSQIAVLIVPSTKPEAIEQYALRVAEQWKIGRKRVDDGAILVIAKNDRALRIEVGYGLEGALNDATSKRIIEETILPRFRDGDYPGGIAAGLASMMKVLEGEALPPPAQAQQREGGIGQWLPVALVAAVAVGGVLRAVLGRFMGAAVTGGVIGVGAFLMAGVMAAAMAGGIAFLVTLLGGGRSGLGGLVAGRGRSSGGWIGGGGFGGGGFGGGGGGGGWGGGGGGFGGGGASGRW